MFIGEVRAHIGKGGLGDSVIVMVNQTHYLDHVEVVEAHWESQAAEEAGGGGGGGRRTEQVCQILGAILSLPLSSSLSTHTALKSRLYSSVEWRGAR